MGFLRSGSAFLLSFFCVNLVCVQSSHCSLLVLLWIYVLMSFWHMIVILKFSYYVIQDNCVAKTLF